MKTLLLSAVCCMSALFVCSVEAVGNRIPSSDPNQFVERLNKLIDALANSSTTFDTLSGVYERLDRQVKGLDVGYERRAALQEHAFHCANQQAAKLNDEQSACQSDTAAIIASGDETIADLQASLVALRRAAEREIADLTQQKQDLIDTYNRLVQQYDDLVGDSKDAADAALKKLRDLSHKFDKMLDDRSHFIEDLDRYLTHLDNEQSDECRALRAMERAFCELTAPCNLD